MESRRILVTGSRDWGNYHTIAQELRQYIAENSILLIDGQGLPVDWDTQGWVIVHGDCPTGADAWADEFAVANLVEVERHPADWHEYGKRAGFLRNEQMVDAGADVCLAFINQCHSEKCTAPQPHGSHGSVDCAKKAHGLGIEVRVFTETHPDPWWAERLRREFA